MSGHVQILWVEMTHDPVDGRGPLEGPAVHPTATWVAVYDKNTLERLCPQGGLTCPQNIGTVKDGRPTRTPPLRSRTPVGSNGSCTPG